MAKIAMDEKVYRIYRYDISETDIVRLIVITSLVISCTLITALSFSRSLTLLNYQLFFIPILYAAYFYAKRGLIVAGICGIVYQAVGYYYRYPDPAALMSVTSEAFLFVIIASLMTYFIERIRAGEARYRSVFEHSQLGIVLFDLPDYRIKQTNDKFAEMLSLQPGRDYRDDFSLPCLYPGGKRAVPRTAGKARRLREFRDPAPDKRRHQLLGEPVMECH